MDIVERLLLLWDTPGMQRTGDVQVYLDAAEEIKKLRAIIDKLEQQIRDNDDEIRRLLEN